MLPSWVQIEVLETSKDYRWLKEMLECFHNGDLHKYDELCNKHKAVLNSQPALTENVHQLRQKITILCLMELIFRYNYNRNVHFSSELDLGIVLLGPDCEQLVWPILPTLKPRMYTKKCCECGKPV